MSNNWKTADLDYRLDPRAELPGQIATAIRDAILTGKLDVESRLPSESELAERFGVSRPTVREALKRLAAQNLIHTRRGAAGGAFVNRMSFAEAQASQVTTSTLLLSLSDIGFETACEARYALERSCVPLAILRREARDINKMRHEIVRQSDPALSDEAFCASDVALHRTFVDAAGNPVMSYHLAGAVEAMQPLMNMITYTARDRQRIVVIHEALADALEARDAPAADDALAALANYTIEMAETVRAARKKART